MTGFFDAPGPRIFAHRGWHLDELGDRENALSTFQAARDHGIAYVETDVHATSDGVIVVNHDPDLRRTADRSGDIARLPWSEVSEAKIAGVEPLCRLEDVLEECPDTFFNVDVKANSAVKPMLELLRRTNSWNRVCVASFSDARLRAIRSGNDEVLTSAGQLEVAQLRLLGRINRRIRCVQVPVSAGPITVVTPKFLAAAHRNGIEVHVWTIDDPAQMRELLSLGVDGIVTDRPDLALRVMTSADSSLPTPLSTSSDQVSRNP